MRRKESVMRRMFSVGASALLVLPLGMTLFANGARADDAKMIYAKQCAVCHGKAGKGDGPAGKMLKPPPADFATALKGQTEAQIAKVIKEGGAAVGKAKSMPAFKKLSDDDVNALAKLVMEMGGGK